MYFIVCFLFFVCLLCLCSLFVFGCIKYVLSPVFPFFFLFLLTMSGLHTNITWVLCFYFFLKKRDGISKYYCRKMQKYVHCFFCFICMSVCAYVCVCVCVCELYVCGDDFFLFWKTNTQTHKHKKIPKMKN